MAVFGEQIRIEGLLAGADLSAKQYYLVKLASTAGEVVAAAATTDKILGVLQNDPADGEAASIAMLGITKVVAVDAITAGSSVTTSSTGTAKATSTDNQFVVGVALEAATAASDIIRIALTGLHRY